MKAVVLQAITEKLDSLIAFVGGDILATMASMYVLEGLDFIHPLLKLTFSLLVGVFGGLGGLIGKDIYNWLKKKLK